MNKRVERLSKENVDDFFKVHSGECGWCYCTAWWHPTWDGWTDRTDKQNRQFRKELLEKGEYDGYILYADDNPAGWCQVGQRDRLIKLIKQYNLEPNPKIWAITCFVIRPEFRRKGLATYLLKAILEDLKSRGVKTVEAYPRTTESNEPGEHWKGPEKMYFELDFKLKRDEHSHPVLSLNITGN